MSVKSKQTINKESQEKRKDKLRILMNNLNAQDHNKAKEWLKRAMESSDIDAVEEAKKELQLKE